jgi:predicted anti-sigma-YlaC factor YlaD
MNHKPAIDWLFEDLDELSQTQSKVLQEHLAECDSCRELSESYRQVAIAFKRSEQVGPEAGFASRWQLRLQASREKAHRRQIIATLSFVLGGILVLVGLLVVLAWPWLRSPNLLLWTWIYQWITLLTYANAFREFVSPAIWEVTNLVPLAAWLFGFGLLSEIAVLWVVSYRLLTNPRRITK